MSHTYIYIHMDKSICYRKRSTLELIVNKLFTVMTDFDTDKLTANSTKYYQHLTLSIVEYSSSMRLPHN